MKILSPFDLSYNFVAPVVFNDGTDAVIKLAVPNDEFLSEVEALKEFNDGVMAKLIDFDLENGMILLERLLPGYTLAAIQNDDDAMYIASKVMKKLWKKAPADTNIPTILNRERSLSRIFEAYPEGLGPISTNTLKEALTIFKGLISTETSQYLLHGDLHHFNILYAGVGVWRTIDPKGLIGEREYDIIQFLLNNLEGKDLSTVIEKRIDILTNELNLNKERIVLYGFSHAVLSTCWSIEDEGTYNETFYQGIEIFKQLRKY